MSAAYWDKALSGRISRRRAIGTTLGVSAAAAFLAACGGASSKTVIESSKLFTNTAEEGSPKRGGVFQRYGTEPTNLDSYSQATVVVPRGISSYIYSRLVRFKSAPGLDANLYTPDPDLAESWEVANDGLTYTFKLRKNVKFQDTAPVNGRLFDAQDVIASYNRFKSVAPNYASSFSGIVDSVSAPDSQTVTFKLSKRIANFINLIAQGQSLLIYPKEAGEGFDPKRVAVGTGPWQLDKLNPSQSSELKRNPNYYEKDLPYMDGVKSSFLSDAGTVYAQFLTGNFHTYAPTDLKPEEFAEAFEKIPNIRILPDAEPNSPGSIAFGRAGTPPYFLDDRIRKAVSLAIDRDTLIPTLRNADQFEKMGLPLAYHNQNFVPYVFRQWWVDPRDKEMGDAAQWFAFDQAKAKQLISAAGFPNGFDTEWRFDNRNGATPLAHYTVLAEEMTKVGIRAKLTIDDYNTVFQPKTQVGLNSGMLYTVWIPASDPSSYLSLLFGPGSNRNKLDVNDPTFNDLFEKQNQEIDTQKRRALLIETFKYLGNKMWEVPFSTRTGSYILAHPFVRNIGAYRDPVGDGGVGNQGVVHYWLSN